MQRFAAGQPRRQRAVEGIARAGGIAGMRRKARDRGFHALLAQQGALCAKGDNDVARALGMQRIGG